MPRLSRTTLVSTCLILSATLASGASHDAGGKAGGSKPDGAASQGTKTDYVLQPNDLIRIRVFQEEDLSQEVRLAQESTVTLLLIGIVDLKDKTIRQAEELIRNLYARDFLVNPKLNLLVVEYAKRSVNVIGAVNNAGRIFFPQEQGLSLVDAITLAGGQNRLADLKRVKLTRKNAEGQPESVTVNVDEIMKGGAGQAWPLQKDDVIFVPERIL
jgi:polysaccharide biosynthesis/export protein